jgi:glyoxylate reductase
MTDIFVTRRIPDAGLRLLDQAGASYSIGQTDEEQGVERNALLRAVRAHDVLLSLLTEKVDRELLEQNPRLRGVANHAVGFNNVDVAAATELGVPITNPPGVLTDTTADLTWALLLAIARRIPESEAYMRAGRYKIWGPNSARSAEPPSDPASRWCRSSSSSALSHPGKRKSSAR